MERNGLVQRFEFTLDLSWTVLKDFLEEKGFNFKPSPKDTIRYAQESSFIDYAQELIDGLDIRNELSHDYSGEKFENSEKQLREIIFPAREKKHGMKRIWKEDGENLLMMKSSAVIKLHLI